MKTTKLSIIAAAALLLGSAGGAFAITDTIAVTGTVIASCTMATTPVSFGTSINVLSGAAINAQGGVSATCTDGATYTITLNEGTTSGATVTARKMVGGVGGTDTLNYSLSAASNGGANWGTDAATDVDDTGTGSAQSHTVFGQIPAGQNTTSVGAYSDTITATVTF